MKKDTTGTIVWPAGSAGSLAGTPRDVLTEILRAGAHPPSGEPARENVCENVCENVFQNRDRKGAGQ